MSDSGPKIESKIEDKEELVEVTNDNSIENMDFSVDCNDLSLIEDKSFIIDLVNKNDQRLTFISKEGKSQVWNRYQKIYYKNMETNFVKCMYCNDIKKHNKYLGTATMLRHQCFKNSEFQDEFQIKDINYVTIDSIHDKEFDDSNEQIYNNKQFLQSLMDSNDERLTFEPQIGKSEVWNRFERVLFENKETLYVTCKSCHDLHKQTRFLGTTSLLRHQCQNRRSIVRRFRQKRNKSEKKMSLRHVMQRRKCQTMDEKIRVENKTLKTIIKKCLEMIEKCLCINKTIVLEKKQINVLINGYNDWLIENQDFEDPEEFTEDFEDIFGDQNILDEKSVERLKSGDFSDSDSDYNPSKDQKQKSKFTQRLNTKSSLVLASDLVKKKYIKSKNKGLYHCDYAECGRSFNNSYNLMQHRNKHNPSKYKCDWYIYIYISPLYMTMINSLFHVLRPGCDERFQKKVQYEVHMSCHTNEKNFKCDFEGCHYETCHSLRSHSLSLFVNKLINYLFFRLKRHKKFHSTEKPFKCDWSVSIPFHII